MQKRLTAAASGVAVVSLAGLSALHVLWATGSAWPARDRATLADAVGGFTQFPGAGACLSVAALLGAAAACVARPRAPLARLARAGSAMTAATLFARGAIGLAGRMPQARRSRAFAALDRRVYSPLCLGLALAALAGTLDESGPASA